MNQQTGRTTMNHEQPSKTLFAALALSSTYFLLSFACPTGSLFADIGLPAWANLATSISLGACYGALKLGGSKGQLRAA